MATSLKPSFTDRFTSTTNIYYGWVIVFVSTLLMGIGYGIMYSYSVFFKPILDTFGWDRATVSSVYSVSLILRGAASILTGWLSDRYGPTKITSFCGIMLALGLVLSAHADQLWQFYITYGLILSIGLSGSFTIGSSVTSRWFNRKRAVALAIISTGSGLGTLIIVPVSERLIQIYNWQFVFIILGLCAGFLVISTSFLLRLPPFTAGASDISGSSSILNSTPEKSFKEAAFSREMFMLNMIYSLIMFCMQMVMIHLVNIATDIGISSLEAAGFISTIGVVSIAGRLVMGSASTTIGTYNSILICIILRIISLFWLFFCHSPMDFYIFAIIFGFAYGGEIPQIPLFIGGLFGVKSMAALMGLLIFVSNIMGALGPYAGGKIYDLTSHYHYAIMLAFLFSILAFILALRFKKTTSIAAV